MTVKFIGGARTVTGSCFLIEHKGLKILIDCGLYQGHRDEAEKRNRFFGFEPASLDFVLLTHAHIDHSGNIPTLVKRGFHGKILATKATCDLCSIMLIDSAKIQEGDIKFLNKKRVKMGLLPKEPLYSIKDAEESLSFFEGVNYGEEISLNGINVKFRDAGHILGSASLEIKFGRKKIVFSGDLGRMNLPVLRDPFVPEEADYIVLESTYGGKIHPTLQETANRLEEIVKETYNIGGKVLIPAFSVGRTQEIVYELHKAINDGRIPNIPVYVDSPLSVNATEIFRRHPECYDEETNQMMENSDPFGFSRLRYISSKEESKRLNDTKESCIIISASGMCESGRILHHLANSIEDSKNAILIVGFQADGTLGKRLVNRESMVRIFGEEYEVRAKVVVLNGFSAHADQKGLLQFISKVYRKMMSLFIVHGEYEQSVKLKEKISSCFSDEETSQPMKFSIEIPEIGDEINFN